MEPFLDFLGGPIQRNKLKRRHRASLERGRKIWTGRTFCLSHSCRPVTFVIDGFAQSWAKCAAVFDKTNQDQSRNMSSACFFTSAASSFSCSSFVVFQGGLSQWFQAHVTAAPLMSSFVTKADWFWNPWKIWTDQNCSLLEVGKMNVSELKPQCSSRRARLMHKSYAKTCSTILFGIAKFN